MYNTNEGSNVEINHTVGAARIVPFLQFSAYNATYFVNSVLELTIIVDAIWRVYIILKIAVL